MKKILAVLFAITLVVSMTTVFAAAADEPAKLEVAGIEFVGEEADVKAVPQNQKTIDVLIDGDAVEGANKFATEGIVLIQNLHCTEQDVFTEYSLVLELEEVSYVSAVVIDFYYEYNSMIGYPKDNAVKIERSTDGSAYFPVETLSFEAEDEPEAKKVVHQQLDLSKDVEAKYIKLTFNFGDGPHDDSDGKTMWEWIGFTEIGLLEGEAPADDDTSDTADDTSDTTSGTPSTGDYNYVAFIAVAAISLAGAVVIGKVRRRA